MENSIFIKVNSSKKLYENTGVVSTNIESIIVYLVYKYCAPDNLNLHLIFPTEPSSSSKDIKISIKENGLTVNYIEEVPWQVSSCIFPIAKCNDTIITGMCAVARHICKYRSRSSNPDEHEEGLLGFRHSCLQAPNEASVWTKFCEIDIVKTTEEVLKEEHNTEFPSNAVRFENHLKKPVKVHNVYKIARNNLKNNDEESSNNALDGNLDSQMDKLSLEEQSNSTSRVGKNRKWKSTSNETKFISSSTPIEQLQIDHKFAEGPFLTLADLVLYPSFYIIAYYYGDEFIKNMENAARWIKRLNEMDYLKPVSNILEEIKELNNFNTTIFKPLMTPLVSDVSLYKCDPKRHNPKKRLFTKEDDIEKALGTLTDEMELPVQPNEEHNELNWSLIPPGANPKAGHLPDKRMDRKCQQLENLALATMKVAVKGDLIVDFCSGSGHLGILVAHLLPECTVILLENKEQSLARARDRVKEMGLTNVYFFQCNLDFFIGKFDIGLALHACGIASDLVLDKCLEAKAKFIICPCCYGSLHATDRLKYPRSGCFSSVPLDEYMCIGHAADQTHSEHPLAIRGARCMAVIDSDRAKLAQEAGYTVTLSRLKPLTCTPKNNLIIGVIA